MRPSEGDFLDAARTVWAEARGEPWIGQIAVAHVIITRAERAIAYKGRVGHLHSLYGEGTLSDAVRRPYQFSPWTPDDPQRDRMLALRWGSIHDRDFQAALLAVLGALHGKFKNPAPGATHFFAKSIAPPPWAQPDSYLRTIGRHHFYDLGDG